MAETSERVSRISHQTENGTLVGSIVSIKLDDVHHHYEAAVYFESERIALNGNRFFIILDEAKSWVEKVIGTMINQTGQVNGSKMVPRTSGAFCADYRDHPFYPFQE